MGPAQGVKIYDCASKQRISFVERDKGRMRADLYYCSLCWKSDTVLLIAWGDVVHVVRITVRASCPISLSHTHRRTHVQHAL
jgi:vacuolar protein sorting-associated protein 41